MYIACLRYINNLSVFACFWYLIKLFNNFSTKGINYSICYSQDNWSLFTDYLATVIHLTDRDDRDSDGSTFFSDGEERPDKSVRDVAHFLCYLYALNSQESNRLRGPYLMKLEYFTKLKIRGVNATHYLGN